MKKGTQTKPITAIIKRKASSPESAFDEIVGMIEQSRQRAAQTVNAALVDLYWRIGEYLALRIEVDGWGKGTVQALSVHVQKRQPGIRGFSPQNLWRMRQFFEIWRNRPKLSALLRELPWTQHMIILGQSKRSEEQEFYLRCCIAERWSSRELERQLRTALFERAVLNPPKVSPLVRQIHPAAAGISKNTYFVEFLQLPGVHTKADMHRGLSRSLSPALIAEYQTQLPDKKLLQAKLHEFYQYALAGQAKASPAPTATSRKRKGSRP